MTDASPWAAPVGPASPGPYSGPVGSGPGAPPAADPYAPPVGYGHQGPGYPPAADPYAPPVGYGHQGPGYPLARRFASVTGLGHAVVVASAAWLVLDVVEALTSFPAADRFAAAAAAGAPQPLVAYDGVVLLAVVAQLVAFVLTGLWLLAVRRNTDQVARSSQRRGVVWTFLGWVVPVVSLWFPLQVVSDAGRASTRRELAYGVWWGLFLGVVALQQVGSVILGGVTGEALTAALPLLPVVETGSAVLLATAFSLWTRIVLTVSAAHARWAATQDPTPA